MLIFKLVSHSKTLSTEHCHSHTEGCYFHCRKVLSAILLQNFVFFYSVILNCAAALYYRKNVLKSWKLMNIQFILKLQKILLLLLFTFYFMPHCHTV